MKIDVIIPTYKPGKELLVLLERLDRQTVPVSKIILMNTEEKLMAPLLQDIDFAARFPKVELHHVTKAEFDHGGTRRLGVSFSDADVFVCMTQDAMPADEQLIEHLTANLSGKVGAAYARQMARESSTELERISRIFNYPEESRMKTAADLDKLGIKTFFCSNVCAAYRRDLYEELGGFVKQTIFNEDMIYASAVIRAGYAVSYEAEAKVIHSHNYKNMQQFHRNFDLGVSQAQHPEVFANVPSESEGKKLVAATFRALQAAHKTYLFPGFCMQCGFKLFGYKLGKNYEKLPKSWVIRFSDNKAYWEK